MSIGSSPMKSRPSGAKERTEGCLIVGNFATTSTFQSGGALGGKSCGATRRAQRRSIKGGLLSHPYYALESPSICYHPPMDGAPALEIRGLTKRYGDFLAVDGL